MPPAAVETHGSAAGSARSPASAPAAPSDRPDLTKRREGPAGGRSWFRRGGLGHSISALSLRHLHSHRKGLMRLREARLSLRDELGAVPPERRRRGLALVRSGRPPVTTREAALLLRAQPP